MAINNKVTLMDIFSSCHATTDGIDISIINRLNKPRRK